MLIALLNKNKRRVIEDLTWSTHNGHTCEVVDPELLQELLTNPAYDGEFSISPNDDLMAIVGDEHTTQILVIYGRVTSVEALARLSKEEVKALTDATSKTARTISEWVKRANEFVSVAGEETGVSAPDE